MPRSAPAWRAGGAPQSYRGASPRRTPQRRRSRGPHAPLRSGVARRRRASQSYRGASPRRTPQRRSARRLRQGYGGPASAPSPRRRRTRLNLTGCAAFHGEPVQTSTLSRGAGSTTAGAPFRAPAKLDRSSQTPPAGQAPSCLRRPENAWLTATAKIRRTAHSRGTAERDPPAASSRRRFDLAPGRPPRRSRPSASTRRHTTRTQTTDRPPAVAGSRYSKYRARASTGTPFAKASTADDPSR